MTYVFETTISGKDVVVEYTLSSVTHLLKVVDMTVDGKYHRLNWMSKEGQSNLMDMIERDYLDNHSEWLGVTNSGVIRRKAVTF
tara:strand:- start:216 stop:467 length:252 start_codon:yes stop_codon:yes gene_type:complete